MKRSFLIWFAIVIAFPAIYFGLSYVIDFVQYGFNMPGDHLQGWGMLYAFSFFIPQFIAMVVMYIVYLQDTIRKYKSRKLTLPFAHLTFNIAFLLSFWTLVTPVSVIPLIWIITKTKK